MYSASAEFIVAYDDGCGPCCRFKAFVELLDVRRRIGFVSLETADRSGMLDSVDPDSRYASFHLIRCAGTSQGAEVRSGSEAVLPLMCSLSPWGRRVSRAVATVPGGRPVVRFVYSTLSRLHRGCPAQSV